MCVCECVYVCVTMRYTNTGKTFQGTEHTQENWFKTFLKETINVIKKFFLEVFCLVDPSVISCKPCVIKLLSVYFLFCQDDVSL